MKIERIKLVTVPYFCDLPISSTFFAPRIPPVGMAMITASCRDAGYSVDQDDLNIKLHTDNFKTGLHVGESEFLRIERIVDFVQGKSDDQLEKVLRIILDKTNWDNFDAYLFSCITNRNMTHIATLLGIGYLLKKRYPGKPFIAGGPGLAWFFSDAFFREMRKYNVLDFIIQGRGEESILELFEALKKDQPLDKVRGLIFERSGEVHRNPPVECSIQITGDYDGLPLDLYRQRCLAKYAQGKIKADQDILILPYSVSSGCPHRCAFCLWSAGKNFKHKSITEVVQDLQMLKERYKTKYFAFFDPTLNFSYQFILEFCKVIISQKLDIRWNACVHAENLDRDLLSLMKDSGAIGVYIGLETVGEGRQKYIRKGLDLKHLVAVMGICSELGIWVGIDMISGLPHEQERDVQKNVSFLRDNQTLIDEIILNSFILYPGTSFAYKPEEFGLTNIGEVEWCNTLRSKMKYFSLTSFLGLRFDEINGLKWEEKKKQRIASFRKILASIPNFSIPKFEHLSYLFYFYEHLQDKREIKRVYARYAKELQKKAVFRSWHPMINLIIMFQSSFFKKCFNFFLENNMLNFRKHAGVKG